MSSVVITGAPATLLVGDSARLVATAVNATGGVVTNQRISWRTSNPAVVAVSSSGTIIGLGAGLATITASAAGREGTAAIDVRAGGTIGTAGGTLTADKGTVTLSVPAGGLAQSTLILLRPAVNAPSEARLMSSTAYELGPDGLTFGRAATLSIKYDPAKVPAGLAEGSLQLYTLSANVWTLVRFSSVNASTKTILGSVSRSGVYAIRSTPVDHITLSGGTVGGALYVGQSGQIAAKLFDANNDSLSGRPITWTTTDPGKATVDATGVVTGKAPGTVTITATSDGKSSTAAVTILTHPTADWSRAGEWTTYQANASHTGYVDATLDPAAFRERWIATPISGVALNPATIGGGRVYVSSSAYFGAQKLFAFDLATGSQLWLRDFGSIFGINQPTYDNGTVYITSGGHEDTYLSALSASDGTVNWHSAFDSQWEHWKAPVVMDQKAFTAGGYYGGMYGFDLTTGKQNFFVQLDQIDGWAPAAANGTVYSFGAPSGGLIAYDPLTGKSQYQIPDSRLPLAGTPVLGGMNDALVTTGGRLVSADLVGRKFGWEQSGSLTGSPVVHDGVVYVQGSKQIEAHRESDGALLWTWVLPAGQSQLLGNLVLTNNLIFVGTGSSTLAFATYAIDLASHLVVWTYPIGGEMALSGQGALVIVSPKGQLAAVAVR